MDRTRTGRVDQGHTIASRGRAGSGTGSGTGSGIGSGIEADAPADTGTDPQQVERVARATQAFGAMIASSLAAVDPPVTMPQWRVLVLAERAPQSIKGIAADLGIHSSNATRLCERLVRAGLLDRQQLPHNRRQVALTLTAEGGALVDRVFEHRRRTVTRILASLPTDERATVAHAIELFASAVERTGHGSPG